MPPGLRLRDGGPDGHPDDPRSARDLAAAPVPLGEREPARRAMLVTAPTDRSATGLGSGVPPAAVQSWLAALAAGPDPAWTRLTATRFTVCGHGPVAWAAHQALGRAGLSVADDPRPDSGHPPTLVPVAGAGIVVWTGCGDRCGFATAPRADAGPLPIPTARALAARLDVGRITRAGRPAPSPSRRPGRRPAHSGPVGRPGGLPRRNDRRRARPRRSAACHGARRARSRRGRHRRGRPRGRPGDGHAHGHRCPPSRQERGRGLQTPRRTSLARAAERRVRAVRPRGRDRATRVRRKTNREIGTRLFLSVRTVDTHVARVLTKVGVNSRVALAHMFAEPATVRV